MSSCPPAAALLLLTRLVPCRGRNPDQEARPWCYTNNPTDPTDWSWDYCSQIPVCPYLPWTRLNEDVEMLRMCEPGVDGAPGLSIVGQRFRNKFQYDTMTARL